MADAAILLVDDRPENLLALEAVLEPLGYRMVRALSGAEALRAVLREEFAVILLDVQMPGLNGFETATLIKARSRTRHIPIIFLTAISKEEKFVYEGYSVGAVDYMPKPIQPEILRSKVAVFADLFRKTKQVERQAAQLREGERREMQLRHEAALRESEARAAQILENATEAILTFDVRERITTLNRAACDSFGFATDGAAGLPITELLHPDSHPLFRRQLAFLDAGDRRAAARREVFNALRRDGTEFPFEASLTRLDPPSGPVYTFIGRDIAQRIEADRAIRSKAVELANAMSEMQALNDELQSRQAELERAIGARSRFYASMSHELRTPINAILGYSSLLLDGVYGDLNPDQIRGIERSNRAATHLLELVNDVLDLSKIEAGKIDLQMEEFDLRTLVEDLTVTLAPLADRHGCELVLETHDDPCPVLSDPRRVRQILLNLVANAVKFGAGYPVRVSYEQDDSGLLRLAVRDEGPGIAPEDLQRIFEEFVQLPGARSTEGTGLGLPISLRLATLLGGTLDAESRPGHGTTFVLRLPCRPAAGGAEKGGPDQMAPVQAA